MKIKNILINATISSLLLSGLVQAADLDSDSATVSLNVGQYASLTGLDNFSLTTTDPAGSANAVYSGSDSFALESNRRFAKKLARKFGNNISYSFSVLLVMTIVHHMAQMWKAFVALNHF